MEGNTRKLRKSERRAEAVAEYKELTRRVKALSRNDDPGQIQDLIKEDLERCKELYPIVKKKLDGTAADSRHMRELVNLCKEASKRINTTTKPFEMKRILQDHMRCVNDEEGKKLSKHEFSRYITNRDVKTFLLNPPTFEFFYGTLRSEDLIVKERKKRVRENLVETKAVTAKEKNIEVDVEQDSTPKEVEYINHQINRLAGNKREGVPFFEALVDPQSFTQTVENIFHISFLVKEGKVGVKPDTSKKAVLTVEGVSNGNQEVERKANYIESNQSILSFTMEDYKDWISTYNIKQRAFTPRN